MLDVCIAPPQRHGPLTVFPLVAENPPKLPYVLLADALERSGLRITEVGSGTVPELLAINGSESVILVLDGEQLVGARQNRTTNRSLLLPARSETLIPVSCMEQGRWRFDGEQFAPTPYSSPTTVRRKAREVEADQAEVGAPIPASALSRAQGEVWDAIAEHSGKLGAHLDTGALNELYATRSADLERWSAEYRVQPRQVGLLAFLGSGPLGLDLIGCSLLYARVHSRLVRGYVMDALGWNGHPHPVGGEEAQQFLDRVSAARRSESSTVGLGRYAVLSGPTIGGELRDADHLVHLSAFPPAEQHGRARERIGFDPSISPPSRRRRR
jgi:hypothetical protein